MAGTFQWPFSAIHHSIAIMILLNLIFHPTDKTTFSNKLWKIWQKKYKKGQPKKNIDYSYNFSNSYTTECYISGSTKNNQTLKSRLIHVIAILMISCNFVSQVDIENRHMKFLLNFFSERTLVKMYYFVKHEYVYMNLNDREAVQSEVVFFIQCDIKSSDYHPYSIIIFCIVLSFVMCNIVKQCLSVGYVCLLTRSFIAKSRKQLFYIPFKSITCTLYEYTQTEVHVFISNGYKRISTHLLYDSGYNSSHVLTLLKRSVY